MLARLSGPGNRTSAVKSGNVAGYVSNDTYHIEIHTQPGQGREDIAEEVRRAIENMNRDKAHSRRGALYDE
jgi:hypothetical protein